MVSYPLWVVCGELSFVSFLWWAVLCELSMVSCLSWILCAELSFVSCLWWVVCDELSVVSCPWWVVCGELVSAESLLEYSCLHFVCTSCIKVRHWGVGGRKGGACWNLCVCLSVLSCLSMCSAFFSEDIFRSTQPFVLKLCVVVHQHGAECCPRNWDAVFKVTVTVKAHVVKAWLFQSYLLNCWSFWNQK